MEKVEPFTALKLTVTLPRGNSKVPISVVFPAVAVTVGTYAGPKVKADTY